MREKERKRHGLIPRAECPHCGAPLGWRDLTFLDPRGNLCLTCGGVYRNSWPRTVVPLLVAFALLIFLEELVEREYGPLLAAAIVVPVWWYLWLRFAKLFAVAQTPPAPKDLTRVADVPAIFDRLVRTGEDGIFAGFTIRTTANSSGPDGAYVQFSIEEGKAGLDWVLLHRKNVEDQNRFLEVAEALGYRAVRKEMNGVPYLRVEEGESLPVLAVALMHRLYGLGSTDPVEVEVEGVDWPPKA